MDARPSWMKWIERVRERKADSALSEADLEEEEMEREWVEGVMGKADVILFLLVRFVGWMD